MIELNSQTFDQTIQSDVPVAVDFWADWCMPCKIFAPVLDKLSAEMDGKITFCKLNIDEYGEIAQQHTITSIPTVVVFKNGEAVKRFVGARPAGEIKSALEALV